MGRKVGLSVYRFELKERRGAQWWEFALGSDADGYHEVDGYLRSRLGKIIRLGDPDEDGNYADHRAILLSKVSKNKDRRTLAGLILKGEAGAVREIRDFNDPEADPTYRTSLSEGVLLPLYFRFHIEDGRRFGVAMLQTLGTDGLKGYLDYDLRRYFGEVQPASRTHRLRQLVDIKVLEAFAARGMLQDVILINSGRTQDSKKAMERHTVAGESLGAAGDKLAMRIHRRDGWAVGTLKRLVGAVRKGTDPRELIDVPGMTKMDDLCVEVAHGGQRQMFSLVNPDDSPIRYDISSQVRPGPEGFPTWSSIHTAADSVWEAVRTIIDGTGQ